uniref:Uncharacterized protein n=1 Tax=Arundo donax TaxID=35708 RepID=A0A0A9GQP6_ARUDO
MMNSVDCGSYKISCTLAVCCRNSSTDSSSLEKSIFSFSSFDLRSGRDEAAFTPLMVKPRNFSIQSVADKSLSVCPVDAWTEYPALYV